ncbi:MAG: alkaline phosphatase family protein [Rhodanobacteraceae bacterium]
MIKYVSAGAVVVVLLIAGFGVWYFRSGNTRLTTVPPLIPVAATVDAALPKPPAHTVVVIEENKSLSEIAGKSKAAPFLNALIARGALLTRSYGVAHPSQPNYFALFSGQTNSDGDSCVVSGIAPGASSLGAEILQSGRTFVGYAEGLPSVGFAGCTSGLYARKHAPWTHFTAIPGRDGKPFAAFPAYARLPVLAFVIPDISNDMHSGSIERADRWLRRNLGPLTKWSMKNDTLIVITWDESSAPFSNHIPTIFFGPMVRPGRYDTIVSQYRVLRTMEALYHLKPIGFSAGVPPIDSIWRSVTPVRR